MRRRLWPHVALLCLASLAPSRTAGAAEAFLCGANTIVYVQPEDLENKKHTDPCIAAHYGITLAEPAQKAPEPLQQRAVTAANAPAKPPTASVAVTLADQTPKRLQLRPSSGAEKLLFADHKRGVRTAAVHAAENTDFRNVRILNPESPDAVWFRHTK